MARPRKRAREEILARIATIPDVSRENVDVEAAKALEFLESLNREVGKSSKLSKLLNRAIGVLRESISLQGDEHGERACEGRANEVVSRAPARRTR